MNIQSLTAILFGSFLLLAGCSKREPAAEELSNRSSEVSERFAALMGGRTHANAITETGTATAYRIKNPEAPRKQEELDRGVTLTEEQSQSLAKMLTRDDSYLWDAAKSCEPRYGVAAQTRAGLLRLVSASALNAKYLNTSLVRRKISIRSMMNW